MEKTKIPFFTRIKNAIFNFDKYQIFAGEKVGTAIKYILKIALIFSIILTAILTYKFIKEVNKTINEFQTEAPEFKFENNNLIIEGDNKQFIKENENGYFTIIMDSEKENINEFKNLNFKNMVIFLKDKIVLNYNNTQTEMPYNQIKKEYNINNITKSNLKDVLNQKEIYIVLAITILITAFIVYATQILFDILLLSILGYIISRIIKIKFKYGMIFNMCVYSITLSIILYYIYICVNILTGFTIKYFEIAYNSIAYIYIITAMLMIKSDIIKQQIEVAKIVEEQKKVKKEIEADNQEEEKEENKKEDKREEEKQKDKKKNKKEDSEDEQAEESKA